MKLHAKTPQFHTQNCHRSLALYLDSPLVGLFYIFLEAMLTPSEGKAMLIYQINHWKLPVQKPLSYKASKTNKWWRWHTVQQKVKWCTTCYGKRKTSWICRDWPTFESFQSKARWKAFSEGTGKHQQIHVFRPKSIQKKCMSNDSFFFNGTQNLNRLFKSIAWTTVISHKLPWPALSSLLLVLQQPHNESQLLKRKTNRHGNCHKLLKVFFVRITKC